MKAFDSKILCLLVAILSPAPESSAQVVVVDFDSIPSGGTLRAPYIEDGISISTYWQESGINPALTEKLYSIQSDIGGNSWMYHGRDTMIAWYTSDHLVLSREDGGSFDLISFDVDGLDHPAFNPLFTSLRLVGELVGGGTVSLDLRTDDTSGTFETITLYGFENLLRVSVRDKIGTYPTDYNTYAQYDNFVVHANAAVPEPSECALFAGMALLGTIGAHRRWSRRRAPQAPTRTCG